MNEISEYPHFNSTHYYLFSPLLVQDKILKPLTYKRWNTNKRKDETLIWKVFFFFLLFSWMGYDPNWSLTSKQPCWSRALMGLKYLKAKNGLLSLLRGGSNKVTRTYRIGPEAQPFSCMKQKQTHHFANSFKRLVHQTSFLCLSFSVQRGKHYKQGIFYLNS